MPFQIYTYYSFVLGILTSIQKPQFYILIIILKDVLGIINILSNKLQSKAATLGNSSSVIQSVITTFENMRSDEEFVRFWDKITIFTEHNNISLEIPSMGKIYLYLYYLI